MFSVFNSRIHLVSKGDTRIAIRYVLLCTVHCSTDGVKTVQREVKRGIKELYQLCGSHVAATHGATRTSNPRLTIVTSLNMYITSINTNKSHCYKGLKQRYSCDKFDDVLKKILEVKQTI